MASQLLSTILRFITRTIFIRTIGTAYLGINGLFGDILSMLALTELGIDTAINFKLYEPLAEHNEKRVRVLMKFYRNAYFVVGMTVLCLGLCVIPALPIIIKDYDTLEALGINAVSVFLIYLTQSVTSYLFFASRSAIVKADQKGYMLNIVGYVISTVTSIVQIITMLLFKSYMLYIGTLVFFAILKNLINAQIAKHYYPYAFIKDDEKMDKVEIKDTFKDLGALFIYKVESVVLKATDNIVLSSFIGLSIVGLYSNYLLFYTTIKTFLSKLYESVKASMGNLFAVESTEKKYKFFEIMNFLAILLYGTAGVGVAVESNELIECWIGREYTIAFPFSILMGIEILFVGLKVNLGQIRNISGAFRQMWFRPVLGVIINVGVSVALVNVCGIYGVLIGTIASDFFTFFLVDPGIIYKVSFEEYRPVSEYYKKNAMYIFLLVVVCFVDTEICTHVFINHGWLSVGFHIMVCALSVPLAMLIIFRNSHECQYLVLTGTGLIKKTVKHFR